ncbi:hypothetical protein KL905_004145 [Ogataea polymorpha]|uniref:Striatin N-terminal domain-containing protein n=1 Tax=Ogataea polymorpha TaxID=460523 RepID=A0A1B7SJZ3_9ASCO|nr:uncharacterized protein OGAPODRAFT_8051 [Ogataea polymorpha]KAG7878513.1 hypothetical protein KL937_003755 [Ogataea polymorpha]KAG7890457.1 hypothetical protein KL908_004294 [Ogataea polymorpha]KAG7898976.1 hypothetical protein KL935_003984 [Ogataea polymorpha]KAG7903717.1 hypothetical protein KL907_003744 [Ogataea polymorpha]KAG7907331.1 hypothetical protein KL906_004018 [Ogataea polymorpha]
MEQSHFAGSRANGNTSNGIGDAFGQAPGVSHYTLPGVMQYLQSQFTTVERNRMMSDLERSALKLRIVELESERNTLKLQNEKLKARVEELEKEHTQTKEPSTDESNVDRLLTVDNIDVTRLVKARQFLKTATNEILYMLKSPTVELSDPLHFSKDETYEFYSNLNARSTPSQKASTLSSEDSAAADYLDMAISLEANNKPHNDDNHKVPAQAVAKPSKTTVINETIGKCFLVDGFLFAYLPDKKCINVWSNSKNGVDLKHTVLVGSTKVEDVLYHKGVLIVLSVKNVLAFKLETKEISIPLATYEWDEPIHFIDFREDRLVAVFDDKVEILKLERQDECFEPIYAIDRNSDIKFLAAKFTNLHDYDLAILSNKSLILRNTKQQFKSKLTKTKAWNAKTFDNVIVTPEYVLSREKTALSCIWYKDLSFDERVIEELSDKAQLGFSLDDPGLLFVVSPKNSGSQLLFYQWSDDECSVSSQMELDEQFKQVCVGQFGSKGAVVGVSATGISLFNEWEII